MSASQKFDVIVIGAGIAGLGAAALLTKDHGKRVLVLERAPFIGGRALSYVGKGNKVVADGVEMDAHAFRKSLPFAHCYLGKTEPSLEEIFARGLLDGRTIEAGGHGLFWGNKSRVACLMNHLGVHHNLPINKGLGFIKWEGEGKPSKVYQVHKGEPYQWMSEEGFAATMAQLREMGKTSFADMAREMRTSLQDWLERQHMHPEAYEYIKVLAASQTAQAEPAMTPAGDFLGYMAIAGQIKMNLVSGSVATAEEPGTIAIAQQFEKVVLAGGGQVRRDTPVKEVLIEDGRVRGVRIRGEDNDYDGTRAIYADSVICTIPPKYMFRVLPKRWFPSDWVETLEKRFWGAGLLTGWYGMKRPQFPDIGIEPGSFVYMPAITRPDEGFIGQVDMVMTNMQAWGGGDARRAPRDQHEYYFSTALTDEEMRNPDRVNRVVQLCEDWAERTFPNWKRDFEFCIWTPGPEAYGLWRPVGTDRPDVKSPWVEGLYFAGDQYGARLWGGGVDGAALSAVLCVDKMMRSNYEDIIMPEYHRGIPELAA
ncbi:MAG: FAD-dependent oxidoreductase [Rubrivivax sp.]